MTQLIDQKAEGQSSRQIGKIGVLARVGVGGALIGLTFAGVLYDGVSWYEALAGFAGLPAAVLIVHVAATRVLGRSFRATSGLGFYASTAFIIALFAIPETGAIAALFYGSSMLLAAARGYAGCEVLAVSNLVLHRQDEVGCLMFSPLDGVEARITHRVPATG